MPSVHRITGPVLPTNVCVSSVTPGSTQKILAIIKRTPVTAAPTFNSASDLLMWLCWRDFAVWRFDHCFRWVNPHITFVPNGESTGTVTIWVTSSFLLENQSRCTVPSSVPSFTLNLSGAPLSESERGRDSLDLSPVHHWTHTHHHSHTLLPPLLW